MQTKIGCVGHQLLLQIFQTSVAVFVNHKTMRIREKKMLFVSSCTKKCCYEVFYHSFGTEEVRE